MTNNIRATAPSVNADIPTGVDYAFRAPANPITLTGIKPDAKEQPITATFKKSMIGRAKAIEWAAAQQSAGRNLYFQDCSVASVNKRPVKSDATMIYTAHVDIDVQGKLDAEGFAKAKAEILDKLDAYNPKPTDVIDTGNGWQAYWYLIEPLPATPENIARIEAVSKRIAFDLGGDACHDVAHLMRLPATTNFPKKSKRDLGRVKCVSRIEWENDRAMPTTLGGLAYALDELPSAPVDAATNDNTDPLSYAGIGSPEIPDDVDLSALAPDVQKLIREGAAPGVDRSAAIYSVACTMRRFKFTDGQILGPSPSRLRYFGTLWRQSPTGANRASVACHRSHEQGRRRATGLRW